MSWIRAHARALRVMWAVFGVMTAVMLALATAAEVLVFALAFGSPAGSYSGQAHDRALAWELAYWLAGAWVFVLAAMIWPAVRWRRRDLYAPDEDAELAEPDPAGEPAR